MSKSTVGRHLAMRLLGWIGKAFARLLLQLVGHVVVWAARALLWSSIRAVRHPRSSLTVGGLAGLVYLLGWPAVVSVIGVAVLAGSTWRAAARESFDRVAGEWVAQWWRRWWVYRRTWNKVMEQSGLTLEMNCGGQRETLVPELKTLAQSRYWDTLTVGMVLGQELDEYARLGERLRHSFGAERIAVREADPKSVELALMRRDPFRFETVPATRILTAACEVDFRAIPIGLDEHLQPVTLSVLGGHVAVSGSPNAGKASLGYNILRGVTPAWAAGWVAPVFIDPKRQELRRLKHLVPDADYACTPEDVIALLQRLVDEMSARGEELGAVGENDHEPSERYPLRLIFVDELAALLKYWSRSQVSKCEDLLGSLLAFGRSSGFIVIGAIQEPTKDVFRLRDLFARRLALRLPTEDFTEAALVDHAVRRGAQCHRIPEALPGVGFMFADGDARATRIRLGHSTGKDRIAEISDYMERSRVVTNIDSRRGGGADTTEEAA